MYSLGETARANGLVPYHYLRYLLTKLLVIKPDDEFAAQVPRRLKPQDIKPPRCDPSSCKGAGS